MSDRRIFRLVHASARSNAVQAIKEAPDGWIVKLSEPTRSLDQNARLWAMLNDIARQVDWYGKRLSAEDWKHVFSSSLRKLEVVPNLDGTGFVALGLSTSKMSKRELGDMMELMSAFGVEKGVIWAEPKQVESTTERQS